MKHLMQIIPSAYAEQLASYVETEKPDELRLRVGQPLLLRYGERETPIWPALLQSDLEMVLRSACRQSLYAYQETISQGYVTVEGGHRIGICGFGVMKDGNVQTIRTVSSLVIRVSKQIIGCADDLLPAIDGSTLILGPPGSGKTTLLRDLVRLMSDQRKQRISLVDERGELSAGMLGIPQLQVGERTDVLVNIPKADAAMMLLRTMNPQWIAMDEITAPQDITAMEQISYCGVNLLATAHGFELQDLSARPLYRGMMAGGLFRKVVILHKDKSYTVREV